MPVHHPIRLCLVLATLLPLPGMLSAQSILDSAFNPANGNTYLVLEAEAWQAAQDSAVLLGGNLVTVNDEAEKDWLLGAFGAFGSFLVGFNDLAVEGTFEWASGEPVTYTNWCPGEPNDAGGNEDVTEFDFLRHGPVE